ncbi:MAG: sulfatase-like hydrolase/transferase, partial [Gemmatimonadales bacterium]
MDLPLHLEDHLEAATVEGSEVPAIPPQAVEWRFDEPQPDWRATPLWNPPFGAAALERTGEGLRITITDRTRNPSGRPLAAIHVAVPDWDPWDWADVVIRARADSASAVNFLRLGFNLREGRGTSTNFLPPFQFLGEGSPIVRDGTIQTYRLRVGAGGRRVGGGGPLELWRQLVLLFATDGDPGSIDLLSVTVVPKGAAYADAPLGVRATAIGDRIQRTLFSHAPGRMAYRVRVPRQGRVDVGLGVLTATMPVTFAVTVAHANGAVDTVLAERYADPERWAQRSVDLAPFAGRTVTLSLEARAEQPGTVALWGAPTVSGARATDKPNIIFYVIDGAGADWMSVYGYNRRTTPFLERLAEEAVVFEHAYSNATWTKLSTPS